MRLSLYLRPGRTNAHAVARRPRIGFDHATVDSGDNALAAQRLRDVLIVFLRVLSGHKSHTFIILITNRVQH